MTHVGSTAFQRTKTEEQLASGEKDMRHSAKVTLPVGIKNLGCPDDNASDMGSGMNLFKDENSELTQVRH